MRVAVVQGQLGSAEQRSRVKSLTNSVRGQLRALDNFLFLATDRPVGHQRVSVGGPVPVQAERHLRSLACKETNDPVRIALPASQGNARPYY